MIKSKISSVISLGKDVPCNSCVLLHSHRHSSRLFWKLSRTNNNISTADWS